MVKPSSSSSRRAASNNGRSPAVSRRQARPESESEAEAGEGENGVEENDDGDNTIRILIATDNHLGYAEKDPVRGEDSLRAFEEILGLAQTEKVGKAVIHSRMRGRMEAGLGWVGLV